MSALNNIGDQVWSFASTYVDAVRRRLLGANNERLDFLMDSFYKLSPSHQSGVVAVVFTVVFFLVLGFFAFYISRINALENSLNHSFEALQELRYLTRQYEYEEGRYRDLTNLIRSSSRGFRPKPFFESKANQVSISMTDLRSSESDIPPDSPLSQDFRYVTVDFRLPKVSIPKTLRFLGEIEKSGKSLNIHNLTIRARYGDRLYFETSAKVVGYKTGGR